MDLSIDFETRSTLDLKKTGVYVYADHPDTGIWCMAWAIGDDEPEIWVPGQPLDARLVAHLEAGVIRTWNAQFERVIWNKIMVPRFDAPPVAMDQWVCTAAEAAAMALPRDLGRASAVLGIEAQKDKQGRDLMLRMAKPRKILDDGTIVWWDVEDRKQRLYEYCRQDVRTERAAARVLRRLTPRERELYLLDQRINERGVQIDTELVAAAKVMADEGRARADAELEAVTKGAVVSLTKKADMRRWLASHDVESSSVAKPAVARLLAGEIPDDVRAMLEIQSESGKTSLAKLTPMQVAVSADDRARGLLLFHGAGTGRWSGKLIQPHNFPRGEVKDVERFIPEVLAGEYDYISLFAPPLVVISSLLRAMIVAAPGHELSAADFSAIEARVLNWLAGQEDVIESFRAMDAGDKSRHPYKIMAWRMGRAPSPELVVKPSEDYQAGKAAELGCGYQMGWKKFITAAWDVYQVRVTEEQSRAAVGAYRESHPRVVQLWNDANDAAIAAVLEPGTTHRFGALGRLAFTKRGGYLYLILPSRRALAYAKPKVVMRETPWGEMREAVEISAEDRYTRQWGRVALYGGLIVENVVQAVARDFMAEAMFRLEDAGYPVVLTVHDEIVTEPPAHHGSVAELEAIMRAAPAWGEGCPIAVEGWRGHRYRK